MDLSRWRGATPTWRRRARLWRSTWRFDDSVPLLPSPAFPPETIQRAPRGTGRSARRTVSEPPEPALRAQPRERQPRSAFRIASRKRPLTSEDGSKSREFANEGNRNLHIVAIIFGRRTTQGANSSGLVSGMRCSAKPEARRLGRALLRETQHRSARAEALGLAIAREDGRKRPDGCSTQPTRCSSPTPSPRRPDMALGIGAHCPDLAGWLPAATVTASIPNKAGRTT